MSEPLNEDARAALAALCKRRRVGDINAIKGLLHQGSLPWDEQSPNALFVTTAGYGSPLFIGRENFTANGELMGHAPLSAAQIIKKIDAEEQA